MFSVQCHVTSCLLTLATACITKSLPPYLRSFLLCLSVSFCSASDYFYWEGGALCASMLSALLAMDDTEINRNGRQLILMELALIAT